jgi:hypothetical protein
MGDARGVWARSGDVWVIGLGAARTPLRDSKGMRHLALLLERPGDELGALELVAAAEGHAPAAATADPELSTGGTGDAGAALDAQAKAEYRRRLAELQEDLQEAERFNDPERAARAQEELDFLARELAAAVGLGGRDRKTGAAVERARVNVTRSIKTAVDRVAEHDEHLGAHLRASVRTGTFCSYAPPAVDRVQWDFTGAEEPPAPPPAPAAAGLLERERELESIGEAAQRATTGAGSVVAVEGPAGIGKSALLDAAAAHLAAAGLTVLRAQGRELERGFTFGIARQLFDAVLADLPPERHAALIRGPVTPAAAMLGHLDHPAGAEADGFAVLNGLYWLTAALAQARPVAVVIDDLHWADPETVGWLAYLAARAADLRAVVLLGLRPTTETALDRAFAELIAGSALLELAPLSEAAVGEVVRRTWPGATPDFAAACHAASAGNPFFLHELVSSARATGVTPDDEGAGRLRAITPDSVTRSVNARLRSLGEDAAALAQACAILGAAAPSPLAGAVAGLDAERILAAADALAGAGIIDVGPVLDYAHPLIRAAVAGGLAPSLRTTLHERAARELAERRAPPHEIAVHLLQVQPAGDPEAVACLRAAAQHSSLGGAPDTAVRLLERALAEPPAPDTLPEVLLQLGRANAAAAEPLAAAAALEHGLRLAAGAALHAELVLELSNVATVDLHDRVRMLDAEIERVDAGDRELRFRLEAQAIFLLGHATLSSASPQAGKVFYDRLARVAETADGGSSSERELLGMYASWRAIRAQITAEEAKAMAIRALDDGDLMARLADGDDACDSAVEVLILVDAYDMADRYLRGAERRARERGSAAAEAYICMLRSVVALNRGALPEAESLLRSVFAVERPLGGDYVPYVGNYVRAAVAIERGDDDEAERACAALVDLGYAPIGGPYLRGALRAAQGAHDLAVPELRAAAEAHAGTGRWRTLTLGSPNIDLARSLAAGGALDEAVALARAEVEIARGFGAAAPLAAALRALGAALGGEEGLAVLKEAADVAATSQATLLRAHILRELGDALAAAGDPGAGDVLQRALELAERCGAARLAQSLAGRAPAPAERSPDQRRAAELAGEGASEIEVAQALAVSVADAADLMTQR